MTGEDTRRLGDRDEKDSEKRHREKRIEYGYDLASASFGMMPIC